ETSPSDNSFEGRGWRGFHHHAMLCIAAYGFLISERERRFPLESSFHHAVPASQLSRSSAIERPARVPSASPSGRSTRPPAIACASSSSMKRPANRSPPSTKAAVQQCSGRPRLGGLFCAPRDLNAQPVVLSEMRGVRGSDPTPTVDKPPARASKDS